MGSGVGSGEQVDGELGNGEQVESYGEKERAFPLILSVFALLPQYWSKWLKCEVTFP